MHRISQCSAFPLPLLLAGAALLSSCDSSPASAPKSAVFADQASGNASNANAGSSEPAFYQGTIYNWMSPAGSSSDPNQLVRACFHLGPDLTGHPSGPAGRLYAIVAPGATMHACPDGSRRHDHVLSAVPGTQDYVPRWHLINAVPGPNFSIAIMPLTSEQAVLDAAAAGQITLIQTGVFILGPVLGVAK
ncbi:MAG: hypothetical protein ABI889_05965 [Gemmatimonadota bacterium]